MIHVIATITVAAGQREAVLAAFRQNVPAVHGEQGCIEYGPVIDAVTDIATQKKLGPDSFMVVEKWESVAALAAHSTAPHMLAYREKVKGKVLSTDVCVLEPA